LQGGKKIAQFLLDCESDELSKIVQDKIATEIEDEFNDFLV